jgi:type I restriction enzyme S subunit
MGRKRVPLGDYVTEYSVRNKIGEDIPVYSVTNSQGFCTEYFDKEVASKDKTTYKIVPKGYFAYNPSRINVGSVDWQRCEDRVIVSPLYNVFSVSEKMDQQYLYYFLRSDIGRQMIKAKASGSVRDNLKMDMLKEMTIPYKAIEEQKRCVTTLDELQKIIVLRGKEIKKLDELIKARFVEMFGDPVDNPLGWKKKQLQEIVTDDCTISYGIVQTGDAQKEGVPVFRPVDIVNRIPKLEELKKTTKEISDKYKRTILKGREMLITVRANIGDTCIVGEEFKGCNVGRGIVPIRTREDVIILEFLKHLIDSRHLNDEIKSKAKGITLIQLNMEDLREVELILPPIEKQKSFVAFTKQVDKSKVAVQKALDETQLLFDSFMQEYFG